MGEHINFQVRLMKTYVSKEMKFELDKDIFRSFQRVRYNLTSEN